MSEKPDYVVDDNGCWVWQKRINQWGYGHKTVMNPQRKVKAHRWYYEQAKGAIPDGLVIDHLCRNRACVNPDHMEAVTNAENLMRGEGFAATNAAKTHCVNGHELTPDNLYPPTPGRPGRRICKVCKRESSRRARQKNRPCSPAPIPKED